MSASFKYYFSIELPFWEKKKDGYSREAFIKYFTSKGGHQFEGGTLLSIGALSSKYGIFLEISFLDFLIKEGLEVVHWYKMYRHNQ